MARGGGVEPWASSLPIGVCMALHSGACAERDGDYVGPVVNRTARLLDELRRHQAHRVLDPGGLQDPADGAGRSRHHLQRLPAQVRHLANRLSGELFENADVLLGHVIVGSGFRGPVDERVRTTVLTTRLPRSRACAWHRCETAMPRSRRTT